MVTLISNPAGFPISIFFFLAEWKAWGKQFYWHMSSPLFPCSWKTALPVGRLRSIVWTTRLTRQPQRDAPGARESSTPSLPAGKKGPFLLTSAGTQGWAPLGRRSRNVSILDRWLNSLHQLGSPHLSPLTVFVTPLPGGFSWLYPEHFPGPGVMLRSSQLFCLTSVIFLRNSDTSSPLLSRFLVYGFLKLLLMYGYR